MTEHTADLRREEIARPLSESEAWRQFHADIEGARLFGRKRQIIEDATMAYARKRVALVRSQDTATARIAAYDKAIRDFFEVWEGPFSGEANQIRVLRGLRAVLSGETRTGGGTVEDRKIKADPFAGVRAAKVAILAAMEPEERFIHDSELPDELCTAPDCEDHPR